MAIRNHLALILIFCFLNVLNAQPQVIIGNLINGRGTTEKLDRVRIAIYIEKQFTGGGYTNNNGQFQINLTTNIASEETMPDNFQLLQNYPNPFCPATTIPYTLAKTGAVTIDIFNVLGQKVRTLTDENQARGFHSIGWDGKNANGAMCQAGMYFCRLQFENKIHIKKMCLLSNPSSPLNPSAKGYNSYLPKIQNETLEITITDRDISDTTIVAEYELTTAELNLGQIPVHVHPFARSQPDTLDLMSGEAVADTLDIYFERPIELFSPDAQIDWHLTEDSLVAISYQHVYQSPVYVIIQEVGGSKTSYVLANFNLSPRLELKKSKLRRGYVGIDYSEYIIVGNSEGLAQVDFLSTLPGNLIYGNQKITGIPAVPFEGFLHFSLLDNRSIPVPDSAYLIIREPFDIDMNGYAVDILEEYPRDGTHPYAWVNTYTGVTRDLYYKNERIAKANPDGSKSCYCCGITFEDFFRAMKQLNSDLNVAEDINGMSAADMRYFIHLWFVQSMWGDGPGIALRYFGLGDNISEFKNVKKGDYVQLWRTTGSGHSVIFMNWTTNAEGDTTGLRYWSTQGSTNGINYNIEYFDGYGGTVNPDLTYFSRVFSPENFIPFSRSKLENYNDVAFGTQPIVPKSFMRND